MNDTLANDEASGNVFLDCAVEIARGIDSIEGRAEIISLVALKYAEASQIDLAVELAETINDTYLRDQALAWIAAKCIEVGVAEHADSISDTIEDDAAFALATEQMAVAYAEAGAFEKAIEVAQGLAESAPTLSGIALSRVAGGHHVEALDAAQLIDYPDLKAPVLVELAAKALQDQRATDAAELLAEATTTAADIEFSDQRISTLVTIASLYGRSGEEAEALELLASAHEQCNESADFDSDALLAQIAGGFAELKRYERAEQVIEQIENPFQFAHANVLVALAYHKAGNTAKALELLADASEIARDEEVYGDQSLTMRENLLGELAGGYASFGHYDEALQSASLMSSTDQRHRTLGDIASRCASAGVHGRAFQVTELIEEPYVRMLWDLEIVDTLISSQQFEVADHALTQLLARAATMERPHQKAMALMEIAPRLAQREQTPRASQVLFDSLTTLATIDDRYYQSQTLVHLAGKYQKLGQEAGNEEQAVLEDVLHKLEG